MKYKKMNTDKKFLSFVLVLATLITSLGLPQLAMASDESTFVVGDVYTFDVKTSNGKNDIVAQCIEINPDTGNATFQSYGMTHGSYPGGAKVSDEFKGTDNVNDITKDYSEDLTNYDKGGVIKAFVDKYNGYLVGTPCLPDKNSLKGIRYYDSTVFGNVYTNSSDDNVNNERFQVWLKGSRTLYAGTVDDSMKAMDSIVAPVFVLKKEAASIIMKNASYSDYPVTEMPGTLDSFKENDDYEFDVKTSGSYGNMMAKCISVDPKTGDATFISYGMTSGSSPAGVNDQDSESDGGEDSLANGYDLVTDKTKDYTADLTDYAKDGVIKKFVDKYKKYLVVDPYLPDSDILEKEILRGSYDGRKISDVSKVKTAPYYWCKDGSSCILRPGYGDPEKNTKLAGIICPEFTLKKEAAHLFKNGGNLTIRLDICHEDENDNPVTDIEGYGIVYSGAGVSLAGRYFNIYDIADEITAEYDPYLKVDYAKSNYNCFNKMINRASSLEDPFLVCDIFTTVNNDNDNNKYKISRENIQVTDVYENRSYFVQDLMQQQHSAESTGATYSYKDIDTFSSSSGETIPEWIDSNDDGTISGKIPAYTVKDHDVHLMLMSDTGIKDYVGQSYDVRSLAKIKRRYRLQNEDGSWGKYEDIDEDYYSEYSIVDQWVRPADDTYEEAVIPAYYVTDRPRTLTANVYRKVLVKQYTVTRQYRLQNEDGTYPDKYTQIDTGTYTAGQTIDAWSSADDKNIDKNLYETATIDAYTVEDSDKTLSVDIPRKTKKPVTAKHTVTRQYRLQNKDGTFGDYQTIDSKEYATGDKISAWERPADDTYEAASIAEYTVSDHDDTLSVDVHRKAPKPAPVKEKYTVKRQYRLQKADGSFGDYQTIDAKEYNTGDRIATWNRPADDTYEADTIPEYIVKDYNDTLSVDVLRKKSEPEPVPAPTPTPKKYTVKRQYRLENEDGTFGDYQTIDVKEYDTGDKIAAWYRPADDTYESAVIPEYTVTDHDDVLSVDIRRKPKPAPGEHKITVTREYRLENEDGTWGDYTIIDSGTYSKGDVIPEWKREADDTYEQGVIEAYTITDEDAVLKTDISRKTFNGKISYRFEQKDGTFSPYKTAWIGTLRAGQEHTWTRAEDDTYYKAKETASIDTPDVKVNVMRKPGKTVSIPDKKKPDEPQTINLPKTSDGTPVLPLIIALIMMISGAVMTFTGISKKSRHRR